MIHDGVVYSSILNVDMRVVMMLFNETMHMFMRQCSPVSLNPQAIPYYPNSMKTNKETDHEKLPRFKKKEHWINELKNKVDSKKKECKNEKDLRDDMNINETV